MSISTIPASAPTAAYVRAINATDSVTHEMKRRIDASLVRYDAWFLVFVAVILALGATLLAGMAVWCVTKQHKRFTGAWSFKDYGIKVNMECK